MDKITNKLQKDKQDRHFTDEEIEILKQIASINKRKDLFPILKVYLYEGYLKEKGFNKWQEITSRLIKVMREREDGFDQIELIFTWYRPIGCRAVFSMSMQIKKIEEIIEEINKKFKGIKMEKGDTTFGISTRKKRKPDSIMIKEEEDIKKYSEWVKKYLETMGFKELEKYRDIREIDKLVNRFDDFWEDDFGKPYGLGGDFYFRRVVIARLSGNKRWLEVVERNYDAIDKKLKEQGNKKRIDRKDTTKPLPYLVELLKNTKPLYPEYDPDEKKGILSRLGFKK